MATSAGLDTNMSLCVICQKDRKPLSDNRRKAEPLTLCEQIKPSALLNAINFHQTERLLALFIKDFDAVAADVAYHRSCYQWYTNPRRLCSLEDDDDDTKDTYRKAFEVLCKEVEERLSFGNFVE